MMGLFNAVHKEHRHIEVLIETVLHEIKADDRAAAFEAWMALDQAVLAHLDDEETHLLSIFDREDPEGAHALRGEHETIRALLMDLGRSLTEENVDALIHYMWEHAKREEARLYAWADCALPASMATAVVKRVGTIGRGSPSRSMSTHDRYF
jgi:hypothetical protein